MAIKAVCDYCNRDMKGVPSEDMTNAVFNYNQLSDSVYKHASHKFSKAETVPIIAGIELKFVDWDNNSYPALQVCFYCQLDAMKAYIDHHDDRPKAEAI